MIESLSLDGTEGKKSKQLAIALLMYSGPELSGTKNAAPLVLRANSSKSGSALLLKAIVQCLTSCSCTSSITSPKGRVQNKKTENIMNLALFPSGPSLHP